MIYRRRLRHDEREEVSLAQKFNTIGGNDAMWHRGVEFLQSHGIFDFVSFSQERINIERKDCIDDSLSTMYRTWKQWHDSQCGILSCNNL